jgi:hypothetical protein
LHQNWRLRHGFRQAKKPSETGGYQSHYVNSEDITTPSAATLAARGAAHPVELDADSFDRAKRAGVSDELV